MGWCAKKNNTEIIQQTIIFNICKLCMNNYEYISIQ